MRYVWLLERHVDYEDGGTLGVYGTKARAFDAVTEMIAKERITYEDPTMYGSMRTVAENSFEWEQGGTQLWVTRVEIQ